MIRNEKKTQTLADAISNILNVAPSSLDPEDDENYTAKLTKGSLEEQEDDELLLSQFRKENISFLEDVDFKYAGKKGNRKSLKNEDEEEWETDEEIANDDINNEYPSEISDNNSEESQDSSNSESHHEDADDNVNNIDSFEALNANFGQIFPRDTNTQVKKGECVRRQLNIWENLLEVRIQLQKCLITANKMPQTHVFKEIRKQSTAKFDSKINDTKKNVETILNKLLELQSLLLKQYPETRKLHMAPDKYSNNENNLSDEEIESNLEVQNEEIELTEEIPRKRRKLSDYENQIKNNHDTYRTYRNSIIQKWNEKTRVAVIKNNNPVHSVLNQIDHILSDKQKLIRRTQTKRSNYDIVGKHSDFGEEKSLEMNQENDVEIFDDDDFYHQLLRELIETKSSDVTDPLKLSKQWTQLQNIRSKMKRKIDTRATKGRKIRYTVHSKLVNFMAPIDHNASTDEARTELYSSLFGKNHSKVQFSKHM